MNHERRPTNASAASAFLSKASVTRVAFMQRRCAIAYRAGFIAGGAPLADRPFADDFESLVQAPWRAISFAFGFT
jgi:hypothetical protein